MPKITETTRPAPGLRDAIILFALVVIGASLCNLSQTGLNAMISPVMDELGIDVDTGQWLTSAYILVLGVAVPVAAYLQRRVSDRAFAVGSPTSATVWS